MFAMPISFQSLTQGARHFFQKSLLLLTGTLAALGVFTAVNPDMAKAVTPPSPQPDNTEIPHDVRLPRIRDSSFSEQVQLTLDPKNRQASCTAQALLQTTNGGTLSTSTAIHASWAPRPEGDFDDVGIRPTLPTEAAEVQEFCAELQRRYAEARAVRREVLLAESRRIVAPSPPPSDPSMQRLLQDVEEKRKALQAKASATNVPGVPGVPDAPKDGQALMVEVLRQNALSRS